MSRIVVACMVLFGTAASLPLPAQQTGALAGTVYDSVAGAPLAGARVAIVGTGESARSDSSGAFRIADLPPGEHAVTFEHPRLERIGWMPEPVRARVSPGADAQVRLAVPSLLRLGVLGCRAEGAPGTSVAVGRVASAVTGEPIPGARVTLTWAGTEGLDSLRLPARVRNEAVADEEGLWYACDLPQEVTIVARVDHPGFARRDAPFFFEAPSAVHAELLLSPGGRGQTAFLTGRVLSQADGLPLQGAVVSVEGTRLSDMSDVRGLWELSNVPPGERVLRVRHAGAVRQVPVRVPEGGVADVEVRVAPDAYTLAPITVTAARNLGVLQGFYERRENGFGQYITRKEVQQRGALKATDLLSGMRRSREVCGPLIFVDGVLTGTGLADAIHVADIEGVEYYQTGLTTPLEFLRGNGRCSVFAIWTRRGGLPDDAP